MMMQFVLNFIANMVRDWKASPAYDDLLNLVEKTVKATIPGNVLEPEIGEFLIDLGNKVRGK